MKAIGFQRPGASPDPVIVRRPLSRKPCAKRKGWGVAVNWETKLCFPKPRVSGLTGKDHR